MKFYMFQSIINTEIEGLPVNEALLQLVGNPVPTNVATAYQKLLPPEDHANYLVAKRCIEELALYLKPCQTNPTLSTGNVLAGNYYNNLTSQNPKLF